MKNIQEIAAAWVLSDWARKVAQRDSKLAWLLAIKAGVTFTFELVNPDSDSGRTVPYATTDEGTAALDIAQKAHAKYRKAAAHACSQRAALTVATTKLFGLKKPDPDPDIKARYEALCAAEHEAFLKEEARAWNAIT